VKPTDFAETLTSFLSDYLPVQRNLSPNTIKSYRDSFKLLLRYLAEREGLPPERVTMAAIDREHVLAFLDRLGDERGSGVHPNPATERTALVFRLKNAFQVYHKTREGAHRKFGRGVVRGC
jgi:site-specific recombinase XerD